MTRFNNLLSTFIIIFSLVSCQSQSTPEQAKEQLLKTDRAFSKRSAEVGNFQAFMEYAKDDAVLLKANSYPIIGKHAIKNYFAHGEDSSYVLTWEPKYAKVAASADLGYTFGIYRVKYIAGKNKGEVAHGTYTAIWERTPKNTWRFVLDTGNEGLGQ